MRTIGPLNVGMVTQMPGRITPGRRRMKYWLAATHAPVLPALITTSTRFSARGDAIWFITTMDESFFAFIASTGGSSMPITSVVGTISTRASEAKPRSERPSRIVSSSPRRTRRSDCESSGIAWMHPLRIWSGALSPPMTSTAMRMSCFERWSGAYASGCATFSCRPGRT